MKRVSCGGCGCLSLVPIVFWCVLCRLAAKGAQKQAEPPEHEGLDMLADAAALVQASVVSKPVAELHEEPPAAAVASREVAVSDVGAEPQTTAEHSREAVPDAGAEPEADAELSGEPLPVMAARSAAVPVPRAGASLQAPAEETVRPVPADRVGQAPSQADQDASVRDTETYLVPTATRWHYFCFAVRHIAMQSGTS